MPSHAHQLSKAAAARPQRPVDAAGLARLVVRIAGRDRVAFAELFDAQWRTLLAGVHHGVPDQLQAEQIATASFVEVWWLARYHTAAGTDVATWIAEIAARRTVDVLRTILPDGAPPAVDLAPGERDTQTAAALAAVHHRRADLALATLLDRPPADRSAA
jgi:DNA-directed RNA polymerase specialized sigma24 family protein